jgi:hypothetical protein
MPIDYESNFRLLEIGQIPPAPITAIVKTSSLSPLGSGSSTAADRRARRYVRWTLNRASAVSLAREMQSVWPMPHDRPQLEPEGPKDGETGMSRMPADIAEEEGIPLEGIVHRGMVVWKLTVDLTQ